MSPFIIYALPRSRTFWLSKYLTYGPVKCGHEELCHVRGLDDISSLLNMPFYGSVETAAAPWWRYIQAARPDIKTVVVRRPVPDVMKSLLATGVEYDVPALERQMYLLDAKLDQIVARVPDAVHIMFDELASESVCASIFEHCTEMPHDPKWFRAMAPVKLVIDLEAMTRYYHAHEQQLERVGRLVRQRILAKLMHRAVPSESMTFQQEPLDIFIRDAQQLFAQHSIEVGEPVDSWTTKNVPLMYKLEELGALYITTARSNGRMFGYLMSIIGPALDHFGRDGVQTLFYASPDAPGVGLKLQRASVNFLRELGVEQVSFRAGTRGSGEKLVSMFKRLGAEPSGQTFLLNFGGAA